MTRKDLKKHWHILKALKKGWIEPSDVEWRNEVNLNWFDVMNLTMFMTFYPYSKFRLTKEGKEKINKAKK